MGDRGDGLVLTTLMSKGRWLFRDSIYPRSKDRTSTLPNVVAFPKCKSEMVLRLEVRARRHLVLPRKGIWSLFWRDMCDLYLPACRSRRLASELVTFRKFRRCNKIRLPGHFPRNGVLGRSFEVRCILCLSETRRSTPCLRFLES